jgi:hypothetical protein
VHERGAFADGPGGTSASRQPKNNAEQPEQHPYRSNRDRRHD